jgi:hypothetical protein
MLRLFPITLINTEKHNGLSCLKSINNTCRWTAVCARDCQTSQWRDSSPAPQISKPLISGVPRNFVRGGGSTNSVQDGEKGGLGAVAP